MSLRRRCSRLCAPLVFAIAAVAAGAAGASQSDAERVAVIERVSRSVVHVKPVAEPAQPTAAPARRDKDFSPEDFLKSLEARRSQSRGEGTGFVVDAERGLILTAAHIVAKARTAIVVLADGSSRSAAIAGIDQDSGIALLRVTGLGPPPLPLAEREPKAGETAIIVGWMIPLKSVLAVDGMVMGKAAGVADGPLAPSLADYFALDAVIPNGGFGGAPVVDRDGSVIGLVSAIFGATYGPGSLTLMIPARDVRPLVDELALHGRVRRSRIGIDFDCDPTPCAISAVDSGGPAERAGARVGDRIVAIDGVRVESDSALRRTIAAKPVGSSVALTLQRGSQAIVVPVVTEAGP